MPSFKAESINLAYRKAKADLYYAGSAHLLDLLEYEEDLERRLTTFLERLNSADTAWVTEPDFVGTYSIVPKSLDASGLPTPPGSTVYSSPRDSWASLLSPNSSEKPTAAFRLMSHCSIDMHILSALWIGQVGEHLDTALGIDSHRTARANQLRRTADGSYNWYSTGSFEPYFTHYKSWRNDAFTSMEEGLKSRQPVTALTADVTEYFHKLTPQLINNQGFLEDTLNISLTPKQQKLNTLMTMSLQAWGAVQTDALGATVDGLPVGLSASAVIANLALIEFDRLIVERVSPAYYGRYVDDIILVFHGISEVTTIDGIWKILRRNIDPASSLSIEELSPKDDNSSKGGYRVRADYLEGSDIKFSNAKNRLFLLESDTGLDLINSIKAELDEISSEWRLMPKLSESPGQIGPLISKVRGRDGQPATSLGAVDQISINRSTFALTLRDFEAFARDLPPDEWSAQRRAFYDAIRKYIFTPHTIFEMSRYLPRILSIAVLSGDWKQLCDLISDLTTTYEDVTESCTYSISGAEASEKDCNAIAKIGWAQQIATQIIQAISVATEIPETQRSLIKASLKGFFTHLDEPLTLPEIGTYKKLLLRDLAVQPFRTLVLPTQLRPWGALDPHLLDDAHPSLKRKLVPDLLWEALQEITKKLTTSPSQQALKRLTQDSLRRHPGLVFPTRPLTAIEVFMLSELLTTDEKGGDFSRTIKNFENWFISTRGYGLDGVPMEDIVQKTSGQLYINLQNNDIDFNEHNETRSDKRRIALTMFKSEADNAVASMVNSPKLTAERYRSLFAIINDVLTLNPTPDYLVFGELAIPPQWFTPIALKLARSGISLIAGVEYLHAQNGTTVHNQVWYSLINTELGFKSAAFYAQDKQRPAHSEERRLWALSSLRLKPEFPAWNKPPIINHGGTIFSTLICSELTNIDYRSSLRGEIDFLVVPKWNQDLKTFHALVTSAALDLHTYIVQVNNRTFGDTRVRAPLDDSWLRDIAQLKGGKNDYVVLVELDIRGLRAFQSQDSSLSKTYKPLPDGFTLANHRRVTPRGSDAG